MRSLLISYYGFKTYVDQISVAFEGHDEIETLNTLKVGPCLTIEQFSRFFLTHRAENMPVKAPWSILIRFVAKDDKIYYGDVVTDQPDFDVGGAAANNPPSIHAKVIRGDPLSGTCEVTDRVMSVKRLLGPFIPATMPAIRCIGGNYAEHCTSVFPFMWKNKHSRSESSVNELDTPPPRYPIMFPKLPNAVAGYGDDIVIPKIAQDDQADYEIELAVVIGKDALNVSVEEAYDYVIGYTVSNDLSSRSVSKQ
jgi:Fumarylacetoacetate (FAA) hydrolase family